MAKCFCPCTESECDCSSMHVVPVASPNPKPMHVPQTDEIEFPNTSSDSAFLPVRHDDFIPNNQATILHVPSTYPPRPYVPSPSPPRPSVPLTSPVRQTDWSDNHDLDSNSPSSAVPFRSPGELQEHFDGREDISVVK